MSQINTVLGAIDDLVWGVPLIVLIMIGGLLLTIRLRGLQVRHLGRSLKYMWRNEEGAEGEVSSFGALCTALSATIGTGNIVGVATAVCAGGPGALFWMFVAACFGMATKFTEGLLAVKYRTVDPDGRVLGGPFYYIEKGFKERFNINFRWLAKLFACFGMLAGLLGIGTITQINSVNTALNAVFDPNGTGIAFSAFGLDYTWTTVIGGLIIAILVGLVVIGGLRRIANVTQVVIPAMVVFYIVICLLVVICNITEIPGAIGTIVYAAFNPAAVTGGVVGSLIIAMQKGVARGIFSNEAGLGSAPIAAAAAKTREPVRQGLVSMTGTFIDTIIVCSLTGLSIVLTGAWDPALGLEGANVTMYAFAEGIPFLPSAVTSILLMIALALFGFTTILGWNYYAERCVEYLFNRKMGAVKVFRWLYIIAVLVGPYITVSAVWTIADIFNGLMAIPNMVALICLSGVAARTTKDYFERLKAGKIIEFPEKEAKRAAAAAARAEGVVGTVLADAVIEPVGEATQVAPQAIPCGFAAPQAAFATAAAGAGFAAGTPSGGAGAGGVPRLRRRSDS
ncbi:MAG: alanine/glycine:cation symporter family protein [Coriobacteriales bacterium]|jgi:AGCS family alanine or glycine:cation symporter